MKITVKKSDFVELQPNEKVPSHLEICLKSAISYLNEIKSDKKIEKNTIFDQDIFNSNIEELAKKYQKHYQKYQKSSKNPDFPVCFSYLMQRNFSCIEFETEFIAEKNEIMKQYRAALGELASRYWSVNK